MPTHRRHALKRHARLVVARLRKAQDGIDHDPDGALKELAGLLLTVQARYAEGRTGALLDGLRSGQRDRDRSPILVGEADFEVGDAAVLESEVGAGGLEPFVEGAVVGRQLADPLLEVGVLGGVLGGDPLDGLLRPLGLQVADLTEEFTDAGALGEDLGWAVLRASSAFRARSRQVASRSSSCWAVIRDRCSPASAIAVATAALASGLS